MSSKIENIISDKNEKVKNLLSQRDHLFMFEGGKLTSDILKNNFIPSLVVINMEQSERFLGSIPGETKIWLVSDKVMKKISSMKSIPEAITIFNELPKGNRAFDEKVIFVFDNIQDPGNLGSLFRCAAAFGISSIALTGKCVKLSNTKFLRTAQNAVFHISVKETDSIEDFLGEYEKKEFNVYLTSSHHQNQKASIEDIRQPAILVIGNEGKGVSKSLFVKYPSVSLDQTYLVESLNAGVSGCILMNILAEKFGLIKS